VDSGCIQSEYKSGSFYSVVFGPDEQLHVFEDNNNFPDSLGGMRFINLLKNSVDIRRDGKVIMSSMGFLERTDRYDVVSEEQYFYSIFDSVSGKLLASEPIYVSGGNSNTVFITSPLDAQDPTNGLVMIQDYPQDVPAYVAPFNS